VSYVGWVCCWFSSLLREVFLRVLRFSLLLKNQHLQIPIRSSVFPISSALAHGYKTKTIIKLFDLSYLICLYYRKI